MALICGLVFLCACAEIGWAENVESGLWEKAVKIADANKDWVPGHVRIIDKTFDLDEKLVESSETELAIPALPICEPAIIVLKAETNGKNVKAKVQKDLNDELVLENEEEENPFLPEIQKHVTVTPLNQNKSIRGRNCTSFEYVLVNSNKQQFKGVAWLETEGGAPREVSYYAASTPIKTDDFTITRASVVQGYDHTSNNAWHMTEKTSKLSIEAKPFPLVRFKGNVHIFETYDKHWKYEVVKMGEH